MRIITPDMMSVSDALTHAQRQAQYRKRQGDEGRRKNADRKSTRLNSSHLVISYAVFCLKKKKRKYSLYSTVTCIGTYRHCARLRRAPTRPCATSPLLAAGRSPASHNVTTTISHSPHHAM